jgi:hypothetical protein
LADWPAVSAIVDSADRREINSFIILVARSILEWNSRVCFIGLPQCRQRYAGKIKVEIEQWKVAKLCGQSRGIV